MRTNLLRDLLGWRFRANPDYRLVAYEDLAPAHQELLAELRSDREFYGVLLPREGSACSVKSVCRDTARLVSTLTLPGKVAAPLPGEPCTDDNQTLARLVLDGILEIESDSGFVSGPAARDAIFQDSGTRLGSGVLFDLSIAALRYSQSLRINDRQALSARLYFYNRLPLTPRWIKVMPTAEAATSFLGFEASSRIRRLLDAAWRETPVRPGFEGWRTFQAVRPGTPAASEARFKLYVSPDCWSLRDALSRALPVLRELGAPRFKIGRDVYNLLRPDKLVVYFPDFSSLTRAASELAAVLQGVPAHGVPFTAEYTRSGLLSWGADPPRTQTVLRWQERESWRLWLTNRLAAALLDAREGARGTVEPWRYALDRLRLEDIDITRWIAAEGHLELHY